MSKRIRTTGQAREARAIVVARIDRRRALLDAIARNLARELCVNCGERVTAADPRAASVRMRDHWKVCI